MTRLTHCAKEGLEDGLKEHLEEIHSRGYTILPDLLDRDAIGKMRAELEPWLRGQKMGRNDFEGLFSERVYALLAKAPSIATLIEHPSIIGLVDELLPRNYLLSAALAINVHPGETPQRFHIDDAPGGSPLLQKPREMLGVSTIWALDEFTDRNGATEVVPGSHRWPEDRVPEPSEIVQVQMAAGSVVVFAGNLLHRGGANNSESTRLAITPQYCMPWLRQIEHMVLAVPPALAARYSDRIQEMLGYNVIDPGFVGYVDGVHPKRLINPDYEGRARRGELSSS